MTTPRKPKAPAQPTDVSAWLTQNVPAVHELPSGKSMRLRSGPCMNRLVREGIIPNPLLGQVVEVVESDGEPNVKHSIDWKAREDARASIVCAMALEPPVTMEPFDGAVTYDALDERDVEYIVVVAQEGTADLASFRSE